MKAIEEQQSLLSAIKEPSTTSRPLASVPSSSKLFKSSDDIDDLICFCHLRWNFVYQRPQHLLSRASRSWRVWLFEEPIWGDDLRVDVNKINDQLMIIVPHLPHGTSLEEAYLYQRNMVDRLIESQNITNYGVWYYTPMALEFSSHLQPRLTVYDCMDELSAFLGAPPQLIDCEKKLLKRSDVVFTGGYSLYEAKQNRHENVYAFPSSIEYNHFAQARRPMPDPADQRNLPNPRIGFSGVIDERFDRELLAELAQRRPDWQFVLLGPIVKIDPASMPQGPNLHYLGMKAYKELPTYFSNWDVAMLPFAMNESTRYISPTKTPEYLAAGLPVVSTPIHDVIRSYGSMDYVQIADTAQAFEKALELALTGKHPTNWSAIDTFLNEHSWDHTWQQMQKAMLSKIQVATEQ